MRTRSSSKHEPFLMLCDDRKSHKLQDFDAQGYSGLWGERHADGVLKQHLCSWACSCFLTRLNFLIAGVLFTFVLYVLAETTHSFEHITTFFTGMQISDETRGEKSVEHFLETHYLLLCLVGPVVGLVFCFVYYLKQC